MPDLATFKVVFPEFEGTATDEQIVFWFGQAEFDQARLANQYDLAVMLYTAHNLVLGAQQAALAAKGKAPGGIAAPLASKGAGGLSASYDTGAVIKAGAGIYNATVYGQRLQKLLDTVSLGGTYVAPPPRRHTFGFGNRWLR